MRGVSENADALLADLTGAGELKVWSVLVTIFGDLAPGAGDVIAGPALGQLAGRIGIKPAALRVALHRLRKDGWIVSRKEGRISLYRLTESARQQTRGVQEQVYGPVPAPAERLALVLRRDEDGPPPGDWLALGPMCWLAPQDCAVSPTEVKAGVASAELPGWIMEAALPAALHAELSALCDRLAGAPARATPSDPVAALALRVLILHRWRRLALRIPAFAHEALGADWVGTRCAGRVAVWLDALPRGALDRIGN